MAELNVGRVKGSVIITGTTTPTTREDGTPLLYGDVFINTETWNYYTRLNGLWQNKGCIKGADGTGGGGSGLEVYVGTMGEVDDEGNFVPTFDEETTTKLQQSLATENANYLIALTTDGGELYFQHYLGLFGSARALMCLDYMNSGWLYVIMYGYEGEQWILTGMGMPLGGGSEITVDQTYNPNSSNPQSGVAINGLVGDINSILDEINGEVI